MPAEIKFWRTAAIEKFPEGPLLADAVEKGGWAKKIDIHNLSVFNDLASGQVSTYLGKNTVLIFSTASAGCCLMLRDLRFLGSFV